MGHWWHDNLRSWHGHHHATVAHDNVAQQIKQPVFSFKLSSDLLSLPLSSPIFKLHHCGLHLIVLLLTFLLTSCYLAPLLSGWPRLVFFICLLALLICVGSAQCVTAELLPLQWVAAGSAPQRVAAGSLPQSVVAGSLPAVSLPPLPAVVNFPP